MTTAVFNRGRVAPCLTWHRQALGGSFCPPLTRTLLTTIIVPLISTFTVITKVLSETCRRAAL